MFDAHKFKQQFPLFSHPANHQLVYLDNAATTQRPDAVIEAMAAFYRESNANTHRSSHRLARQATTMVEGVREQARAFLGAERPEEVVFTRGATESLNIVAQGLAAQLQAGDEIILTEAEHHANLVPWQMLAQQRGLVLRYVPVVQGRPQLDQLVAMITGRTRVVSLSAASNALGLRLPLDGVRSQLPDEVALVVDASQLLAHQLVDVQALGCDFLVGSAHKFYGPTGVGILYGRYERLAALAPWQGGGEMITRVTLAGSDYARPPHRFEPGTSSLAAIAGLGAALTFLAGWDRRAMGVYEQHLTRYLHAELTSVTRQRPLRLLTTPEDNVGIAALVASPGCPVTVTDMGAWLDDHDIAVRVGHHCAQPLMQGLGFEGSLRVSLAAYNQREDVDRLVAALLAMPMDVQASAVTVASEASSEWPTDDLSGLALADLAGESSWQKRYRALTRWAARLADKPSVRTPANRVEGCESEVWIQHRCDAEGRHHFLMDTDSRVIKGLAVLLLLLVEGQTTETIMALDFDRVFAELGLEKYLSPSRSNGFRALVERVRALAASVG